MEICTKCPRLVEYRESIRPKTPLIEKAYWNKPVLPFGAPTPWLLVIGLAPGAHGANRTSRPFQGDGAGVYLYRELYDAGLCNIRDVFDFTPDLELDGVLITNAVRCVPPSNKPIPAEFRNCLPYLAETLKLPSLKDVLCIGRDAFLQVCKLHGEKLTFAHGVHTKMGRLRIHTTFHTSLYNQSTKRIKEGDLTKVLLEILEMAGVYQPLPR